jgi:RluA family pseudouridine synthase
MQDFWISITPEPSDINLRLDQFLASRYPQFSRSHWQNRIKQSQVLLDSRAAKPNETVKKNSTIKYLVSRPDEPLVNDNIQILYNKDGLLVVDKPADLPVHPGGSYFRGTLVEILKEQHGLDYIAPIQRLDRETSGVMLVCTNKIAASQYSRWLKAGLFQKIYLLAVEGKFPTSLHTIGWQRTIDSGEILTRYEFSLEQKEKQDKRSETKFRRLHYDKTQNTSLLLVKTLTGRHHQIRCTANSIGFPVIGDKLYGVDQQFFLKFLKDKLSENDRKRLRVSRSMLHSFSLFVRGEGSQQKFKAQPPRDFVQLFPEFFGNR